MRYEIKPYTAAAFATYHRVSNECDYHGDFVPAAEFEAEITRQGFGPERNAFLVWDGDRAAGCAFIHFPHDAAVNRGTLRAFLAADVGGDAAFLDELLARLIARGRELGAERAGRLELRGICYDEETGLAAAFERAGLRLIRYFARLDCEDSAAPAQAAPPAGVVIRTVDVDTELARAVACYNAGFEGSFNFVPATVEGFAAYGGTPFLPPELMFVAEAAGEFVGICFNNLATEADPAGVRWGTVEDVAVVPDWRGRGLGRALLRRGMAELRRQGANRICLYVDYSNPYGAKELYYREGFRDRYIIRMYAGD